METENKTADVFAAFKNEILNRARAASACAKEYGRAYKAESMTELCNVIKDNFNWCCAKDVLTGDPRVLTDDLTEAYRDELREQDLFFNESAKNGFLLCTGNATVEAWGNTTVRAWDNATVEAWGNATVRACGNATVQAWGNASVEAWGNAYCSSFYKMDCKISGNAIYRVMETNTIYFASDQIKFEKI